MTRNFPSERPTGWRISSSLSGALIGDFVWALALLGVVFGELIEKYDLFLRELTGLLQLVCGLIALPIALGGWLLIWGDNGPPYDWLNSPLLHIAFGLGFYAVFGAVVGYVLARRNDWRLSTRTILAAFTVIALAIGLAMSHPF